MLLRQLRWYFVAGVIATCTDIGIYLILSKAFFSYNIAKAISFVCATLVAYFGNRKLTFKSQKKVRPEITKFILLYIVSAICNVTINNKSMVWLNEHNCQHSVLIAVILATFFSICFNFIGQKFWIFKHR